MPEQAISSPFPNAGNPAASPPPAEPGDIPAGTRVITWYDDQPVEYGGPADGGPWTTLSFALLAGGLPVRRCEPQWVAPADTMIPAHDARVTVEKRTRAEMPYGEPGVWRLTLPGATAPTWHRTKRDATATGLRRVTILDWHAGKAAGPVVLPHTAMTVPHTRLTLGKLRSMSTARGDAYTADLLLDGKTVGTIENTGDGGATTWFSLDPERFDRQAMETFVAACRDEHLRPLAEEFVLADLFEEARTARDIARFVKAGKVPVRTISVTTGDTDEAPGTFPDCYYDVASRWDAQPGMLAGGMWRQRPDAYAIQKWTGEQWEALPRPAGLPAGTMRLTLSAAGYLVLRTTQHDGGDPVQSTTYIDAAGHMDDEAATKHVSAELAALAEHAPSNVLHSLSLVHRTSDGDRVLLTPEPIRGAGDPLPDEPRR